MNESPTKYQGNPAYDEDDDQPTSLKSFQLKEITNQTRQSGHSSNDHCKGYEVLNPEKERPAQGSNHALFALVIIVCLISLVALLLTLLMLVGKIGCSNEGQCTGYVIDAGESKMYNHRAKFYICDTEVTLHSDGAPGI